jgi:superfamily II DNA or RNA helicase
MPTSAGASSAPRKPKQIVAAYSERGQRADYIHSREDYRANEQVLAKLDRHELDVIVQVRMLGEGFDHGLPE